MRLNIGAILYGKDICGWMLCLQNDLVQRLALFNVACAILALIWRFDLFRESTPLEGLSHPAVAIRYAHLRDREREMAVAFNPDLMAHTEVMTQGVIFDLSKISNEFTRLWEFSNVGGARTPLVKDSQRYADRYIHIAASLHGDLQAFAYWPLNKPHYM